MFEKSAKFFHTKINFKFSISIFTFSLTIFPFPRCRISKLVRNPMIATTSPTALYPAKPSNQQQKPPHVVPNAFKTTLHQIPGK